MSGSQGPREPTVQPDEPVADAIAANSAVLDVPAYTDLKLYDITDPTDASAQEPLELNQPPRSATFNDGNRKFMTRRLWGIGNQPPY